MWTLECRSSRCRLGGNNLMPGVRLKRKGIDPYENRQSEITHSRGLVPFSISRIRDRNGHGNWNHRSNESDRWTCPQEGTIHHRCCADARELGNCRQHRPVTFTDTRPFQSSDSMVISGCSQKVSTTRAWLPGLRNHSSRTRQNRRAPQFER